MRNSYVLSTAFALFLLSPGLLAQGQAAGASDHFSQTAVHTQSGQWQDLHAGVEQPLVMVSDDGESSSFGSNAAMFGTACLSPMIVGWVPFLGPALTGWFVQLVGDSVTGQKKSPIFPILGAYAGQYLLLPVCVGVGYIPYFIFALGGMAVDGGSGLTSAGGVILGFGALSVFTLVGVIGAATFPVVAYNMSDAEEDRPRRRHRRKAKRPRYDDDDEEDWQDEGDVEEYSAPAQQPNLQLIAQPVSTSGFAF